MELTVEVVGLSLLYSTLLYLRYSTLLLPSIPTYLGIENLSLLEESHHGGSDVC